MSLDASARSELVVALCGRGLKKKDLTSNSDPFAVVSVRDASGTFVEVGRTEVIQDTQEPDWVAAVEVVYFFEEEQIVRVEVFDEDRRKNETLGAAEFPLGRLVGATAMCLQASLSTQGQVILRAEEKASASEHVRVQLKGHKLKNKDGLFGRSDPFFEISRLNEDGSGTMVFRSPVIDNNLSPTWPALVLSAQKVANGDMLRPLRVEIRDHDRDGDHESMGMFQTNLQELCEAGRSWKVKIDGKEKGKVEILGTPELFRVPTFLDYLKGGLQLHVTVAVDFTASNGDPNIPGTLHYSAEDVQNPYQRAMAGVVPILAEYDHDKHFDVYGFGARVDGSPVQHSFPLDGQNPKEGVEGVMNAYKNGMRQLALSGPTLLNPILQAAFRRAMSDKEHGRMAYHVLVVICDGVLVDMESCVNTLVSASAGAPLSVVLVGVGDADFSDMARLDGDEEGLRNDAGDKCLRDIVQFVPMRDFSHPNAGARLAKEVLAELPDQILAYNFSERIAPRAPMALSVEGVSETMQAIGGHGSPPMPPSYNDAVSYGLAGFGSKHR